MDYGLLVAVLWLVLAVACLLIGMVAAPVPVRCPTCLGRVPDGRTYCSWQCREWAAQHGE